MSEIAVERSVATRNKLLRVMRRIVEIKAGLRFVRSIPDEPPAVPRPPRPASYFVGVEIDTDLERLADELVESVNELSKILHDKPTDQASPF